MRFAFVSLAVVFVISSSSAIWTQQPASSQGNAALSPMSQSASPEKLVLKEGADVNLKFAQDLSSKTATEGDPVNLVLL
jgi:pyruvate-formate lyase